MLTKITPREWNCLLKHYIMIEPPGNTGVDVANIHLP